MSLVLIIIGLAGVSRGQSLMDSKGLGDAVTDEFMRELLTPARDLTHLERSHVSALRFWDGVNSAKAGNEDNKRYTWRLENDGLVAPEAEGGAIETLIAVPADGEYRISLRQRLTRRRARPVTLSLIPQEVVSGPWPEVGSEPATNRVVARAAGPGIKHVFGTVVLPGGVTGAEVEKSGRFRFDRATQRIAIVPDEIEVWEYWDVELEQGVYRAVLTSADMDARLHSLFISGSVDFRPSWTGMSDDRTLGRIFIRFRALETQDNRETYQVDASLSRRTFKEEYADSLGLGRTPETRIGEWTEFLDASIITASHRAWSSFYINASGYTGMMEIQFAWQPYEVAVLHSVKTEIDEGRGLLRVPGGEWMLRPRTDVPAWGLWNVSVLRTMMTLEQVVGRYLAWTDAALDRLNLPPDHPRVRHIRFQTIARKHHALTDTIADMLARLGINWFRGLRPPAAMVEKYQLFDDLDASTIPHSGGWPEEDRNRVVLTKTGDEIHTLAPADSINSDTVLLDGFYEYLREQSELDGMTAEELLGVTRLEDVTCSHTLPENPGRFHRRLYYHSHRYAHLVTAANYDRARKASEARFPNARVYNNYSPHPTFMLAHMNGADWFVLPRAGAQTMGWAECWAGMGGSFGTAYQLVSFYGALVECSTRKHGYPNGFYIVGSTHGVDRKTFSLLAAGHAWIMFYAWAQLDYEEDGGNSWSDHKPVYEQVARAAAALGPADEIVGLGTREPRRTAILYNRSHEIMNMDIQPPQLQDRGWYRSLNHDWMWTFIALKASQIPVEVIIEEDLNKQDLSGYDCIFVGGFNLAPRHLSVLRDWVEDGGLLIGTAGAMNCDLYGDPQPATDELFGASQSAVTGFQRLRAQPPYGTPTPGIPESVARISFAESEWFPGIDLDTSGHVVYRLTPNAGRALANFADGSVAATVNLVGKGHAVLLGVLPGYMYRDNGAALAPVRAWLAAPALKRLGRQRVEFDYPASEATLFEHESGLAVLLNDFGRAAPPAGSLLSVQTDREIRDVRSALHGPLEWKRVGDRIEAQVPPLVSVDAVVFKIWRKDDR